MGTCVPGVRCATPGWEIQPVRGRPGLERVYRGCAAQLPAEICNPFGVDVVWNVCTGGALRDPRLGDTTPSG